MVNVWWLPAMFFLGTFVGIILMAFCSANKN